MKKFRFNVAAKHHLAKTLIASIFALLLPLHAMAQTPAEQLQNVLSGVDAYSGDFVQKVTDANGKLVQEGKGHLDLAKPGKINWQLVSPAMSSMISNSKILWLYDPDLEQVTLYDPQQLITDSPFALLMSDESTLWQQYDITKDKDQFVVSPKAAESQVTKIALTFKGNQLQSLVIWDASEQQSQYQFSNIAVNPSFDASHFIFDVPEDTDIDDQRN